MTNTIKRCPFCGAVGDNNFSCVAETPKWGRIECHTCGAAGPEVRTNYETSDNWRDAAVVEWNRRDG